MRSRPLAGYGALITSSLIVAACSITDIAVPYSDPVPVASIPVATTDAPPLATVPAPASEFQPAIAAAPAPAPAPQVASVAITPVPQHFGLPRIGLPRFGGNDGGMPAEEVQCRQRLKRLGVSFRDVEPIRESASCGIDYPVEVYSLARGVSLKPKATLNCEMAEELARWTQSNLGPQARLRYLSGVAEVRQMSSYSCRRIKGSGKWSAHSTGDAIDIGAIKLKNGRVVDVRRPGFFAFRARGLLNSVRGGACDNFSTVLGPGYDRAHADHFHFDLMERRSGRRYCR